MPVTRYRKRSLLRRILKGGDSDEKIVKRQAKRDIDRIKADPNLSADAKLAATAARSEELGALLQKMRAENEKDKADLAATLEAYKSKNREILAAYQTILDGQNQLNEYIQLKKFDEVIVEKLLGQSMLIKQRFLPVRSGSEPR